MTRIRISLPASPNNMGDAPLPELMLDLADYRHLAYGLEISYLQPDQIDATYSVAEWRKSIDAREVMHSASIFEHYYALRHLISYADHCGITTIHVTRMDESATPPAPTRIRLTPVRPFDAYDDEQLPELVLDETDYRYLAYALNIAYLSNDKISTSQSINEWRDALNAHESTYHEHVTPHCSALHDIIEYANNHGVTTMDVTPF